MSFVLGPSWILAWPKRGHCWSFTTPELLSSPRCQSLGTEGGWILSGLSFFFFPVYCLTRIMAPGCGWNIWLASGSTPQPGNRTERKEAGLLGPTKSRLGSNLAVLGFKLGRTGSWTRASCWAEVGPKAIQMDPKLKQNPSHVQSGATWDPLATASCQVRPNVD